MKLLPLFVSSSLTLDVPESCLYCEAVYIEGIGIIYGSKDCFEGNTRFILDYFKKTLGKISKNKTNDYEYPCFTATGQITFGEGLNIYAIWRDNYAYTDHAYAYIDEIIQGS